MQNQESTKKKEINYRIELSAHTNNNYDLIRSIKIYKKKYPEHQKREIKEDTLIFKTSTYDIFKDLLKNIERSFRFTGKVELWLDKKFIDDIKLKKVA